jgi:hypothetical protein
VDQARGQGRVARQSDTGERGRELGAGRSHSQVTGQRDPQPRARAGAVDRDHHRHPQRGQGQHQRVVLVLDHRQRGRRVAAQRLDVLGEVLPDAERPSRPGDQDRAHRLVGGHVLHGGQQVGAQRVREPGPQEGEGGNPIGVVPADGVGHRRPASPDRWDLAVTMS